MNKFAEYVRDELNRISFFLRYAGVLEDHFPKRVKDTLLSLPVTWDDNYVLINGKKAEEATEQDYFYSSKTEKKLPKNISIKGKVKDRPFTLKIDYGDFYHLYYLDFEDGTSLGKKKKIRSMDSLKKILENINEGKENVEKDLSEVYSSLFKGKENTNKFKDQIISKFFSEYTDLKWEAESKIDLQKGGDIKVKIFTKEANPEQYKQVFKMLTETDPERAKFKVTELLQSKIPNYVSSLLEDNGYKDSEVSIKGVIRPSVSENGGLSGNLGFTVTIS